MGFMAGVITALAVLGFILANTVAPDAINMAIGCTMIAPVFWACYASMRYIDRH